MTEPMRWRMIGYMAALFLAGAITGTAIISKTAAAPQTLKVGRADEIAAMIRQKLSALELTPEQQAKFDPLIKKASEELESFHLQCLQQSAATVDKLHAQLDVFLTPEQREKMKVLDAERRALMRQKYNYPPEPGQPGTP